MRVVRPLFLGIFLWVEACATAPNASAPMASQPVDRALHRAFSIPIPQGFEQRDREEEDLSKLGGEVVLARAEPPATIVVAPVPAAEETGKASSCAAIAADTAKSFEGTLMGAKTVRRRSGTSCQVLLQAKRERNLLTRADVLPGAGQRWMVACKYARTDRGAPQSCDEVVEGFESVRTR